MAIMKGRLALVLLCLVVVVSAQGSGNSVRGVNPAQAKHYGSVDGTFTCIDGSKTMPFSRVNDEYCDCLDGSDEPGTAACPNGQFYCANIGFQPLILNATMIDDGVCDCCDGADEQPEVCNNRCEELGSLALASMKEELAAVEVGLKRKDQYVRSGQRNKVAWKKRLGAIGGLEQKASKREEKAKEVRDKLEKQQRSLQSKKQQLEDLLKSLEPQPEPEAQPEEEGSIPPVVEEVPEGETKGRKRGRKSSSTRSNKHRKQNGEAEEENADNNEAAEGNVVKQETEEERAKRVAAQWIPGNKDKEEEAPVQVEDEELDDEDFEDDGDALDGSYNDNTPDNAAADDDDVNWVPARVAGEDDMDAEDDDEGGHVPSDDEDVEGEVPEDELPPSERKKQQEEKVEPANIPITDQIAAWFVSAGARLRGKRKERAELESTEWLLKRVRKRVTAASKKVQEASDQASSLRTERETLDKNLGYDFGPDGVYSALLGKCFEAQVDKYKYKVCPYGQATQDYSSLGNWAGWENNFTVMKFTGGQNCWSGPDRSMTVKVRCGKSEEVLKVAEPSRCEYTSELITPAACTSAMADSIRAQLASKAQLLAEAAAAHSEL